MGMRAAEDHAASVLASQPLARGLLGDVLEALTSTHAEGKRGGDGGSVPKATQGQGGQGAREDKEVVLQCPKHV